MIASRSPRAGASAKRVVVTGMGLVTPAGIGIRENWQNVLEGRGNICVITKFDAANFSTRIASEVKNFDPLDYIDKKDLRKMDPFIQFAVAAAELAVEDAAIDRALLEGEHTGVYIGSGIGGIGGIEDTVLKLHEKGPGRVSPYFLISTIINEASGQVSIRYRSRGPNLANATACATSTHSIGDSFKMIVRGDAKIMITGGAEAPITPLGMAGFCAMRALSQRNDDPDRASRPFDADRDGFIVGEGAGVLILEELGHAQKRGAKVYAEIVGYGMSGDAHHSSAPCPDGQGAYLCMNAALKDAGLRPEEIGYINAHGTSTPWNDKIETLAIKKSFGDHAYKLAISSTKSVVGHLLGAAGGVEAAYCILALNKKTLPPTINYETPDPECDLDYITNEARNADVCYALSNSFGFGGTNGTLIFKRFDS